ncbi:uncharacterized protein RCC_00206 [Ramularia collo-cygni]|uniref:Uncharacterized protein n=1 Tax=Ramularia collo-cygni TaxID=112498 RepID=A0A2D3ULT1_9PEZI|nr:uncharacterized protein RCC_00206 [Ramularia collo-cygni]CZT14231.1 uncharacterized protein RCC_00206 [Ramularia collo-cygni]
MGLLTNIQDKLAGNKDGVNSSYDTTNSSHQPTHGTTTTSTNPLSSSAPHGNSGITGGSHPLVSGDNNTTATPGYGSGQGSHLSSSTGQYTNTGVAGTHHSGPGLTGTSHSTGLTDSSHTGNTTHSSHHVGEDNRGMMDKAKDALSSKRSNHPDDPITGTNYDQKTRDQYTDGSHTTGSHGGIASHQQHGSSGLTGTSHSGPGLTGTSHSGGLTDNSHTGHGLGSNTHTTGSGLTSGTSHHDTHTGSSGQHVGIIPASHPAANNPSAIPTAGGQRVGSVDANIGNSGSHAGVHETMGDKVKNALPGQHGNAHDAYGNPIHPSSTSAHTTHPTGSHATGTHTAGGLTGSNTTHGTHSGPGFSSSAQPLSHDSHFNDRHSGPGAGTGLAAGAVGGAGLASAGHHNTHDQTTGTHGLASHQQHGTTGLTGSNTHSNTHTVGEDNRGLMDKAKDALSSKRSNQPDDPITGTNYDQKNRDQHTTGTHGSGLTGTSHDNNSAYNSTSHQSGISGITSGVGQTHLGSNTHSGTHSSGLTHESTHIGRSAEWKDGYQAGYREAQLAFNSHSSSTGTHSGSHLGSSGNYPSTSTAPGYTGTTTKPTMGDKLNPKTDADRDGKVGIMD